MFRYVGSRLSPRPSLTHVNIRVHKLSFAYEQNEAADAALKSIQRAIDLTTEQNGGISGAHGLAGLHFAKGRVYSKLKEKYKAIDCLNEALKIYPAYVKALKLKSMIGAEIRQLSVQIEAREGLARALTGDSEVGSEYFQLAKLHLDNKNYKRAQFCIEEALSRLPDKQDYVRFKDDLKRIRRGSRSRSRSRSRFRSRSASRRYLRHRRSPSRSRSRSLSPKRRHSLKVRAWKGGKYRSTSRSSAAANGQPTKQIRTAASTSKVNVEPTQPAVLEPKPRSAAMAWAAAVKPGWSTATDLVPAVAPISKVIPISNPLHAAAAAKSVEVKTVEVSAAEFRQFNQSAFANWLVVIGGAFEGYGPPVTYFFVVI